MLSQLACEYLRVLSLKCKERIEVCLTLYSRGQLQRTHLRGDTGDEAAEAAASTTHSRGNLSQVHIVVQTVLPDGRYFKPYVLNNERGPSGDSVENITVILLVALHTAFLTSNNIVQTIRTFMLTVLSSLRLKTIKNPSIVPPWWHCPLLNCNLYMMNIQ